MKTISVKKLKRAGACNEQVELFEKTFGKSARITKANCLKAASVDLDFTWAARHFLSGSACRDYHKADLAAWMAYMEAREPYAKDVAWKTYKDARAIAWKAYSNAKALAFYEACK